MSCTVSVPSRLQSHVDGQTTLEVEAGTVRAVIRAIEARYPGFEERLGDKFAVAIDGEMVADPLFEPVPDGSEVHFLPALAGG